MEGKSSPTGEGKSSMGEGKVSSSSAAAAPGGRSSNLIKKLTKKVLKGMSKLRFKEWFSGEEVDQFRDNPDVARLDPLFLRWQDNMEQLLRWSSLNLLLQPCVQNWRLPRMVVLLLPTLQLLTRQNKSPIYNDS